MDPTANDADRFVTRTTTHPVLLVRVVVGAFAVCGAGLAVVNLVWLGFTTDRSARIPPIVAGVLLAVLAVLLLRWLGSHQRMELIIDHGGVTVVGRTQTRSFPWSQITGLAVVTQAGLARRALAIEGTAAAEAARTLPKLATFNWFTTRTLPLATVVPLGTLEANEHDVIAALEHYSNGRFPDPDRR